MPFVNGRGTRTAVRTAGFCRTGWPCGHPCRGCAGMPDMPANGWPCTRLSVGRAGMPGGGAGKWPNGLPRQRACFAGSGEFCGHASPSLPNQRLMCVPGLCRDAAGQRRAGAPGHGCPRASPAPVRTAAKGCWTPDCRAADGRCPTRALTTAETPGDGKQNRRCSASDGIPETRECPKRENADVRFPGLAGTGRKAVPCLWRAWGCQVLRTAKPGTRTAAPGFRNGGNGSAAPGTVALRGAMRLYSFPERSYGSPIGGSWGGRRVSSVGRVGLH